MLARNSSKVLKDLCWRSPSGQAPRKRASAARCHDLSKRHFSASRPRLIKTADMGESDLAALKVDGRRLMDTLHHTCKFGTGLRWGRQAFLVRSYLLSGCLRAILTLDDMKETQD